MKKKYQKYSNKKISLKKNFYSIVVIGFLIWMLFFDSEDFITQIKLIYKIKSINEKKNFYKHNIKKSQQILENLENDSNLLEKFAREKYLMKKKGEDIYLIQ